MDNLQQSFIDIWKWGFTVNINQYIYVFTAGLLFVMLPGRFSAAYRKIFSSVENALVKFLKNRELFFVHDSYREEIWLNLLRIVAGYSLFSRSFWIFYYEVIIGGSPTRELVSGIDLISSFFFMIGFLTPIFNVILFLFHTYVHDMMLSTFTLGSCLAQILIMIFMFLPAGRCFSIDAIMMSTDSLTGRILASIYSFFGRQTTNRIAIVKFCAFISYGLLCMYSVYEHFRDPYWARGIANVMLLSSNWLVAPYESFRSIFSTYGKTAIIISMISLYIMMAWEFVIIPFALIKGITRQFVIWWGLAFFAVSLFVLQLSWLPYYQIILFAILFWPGYFLNRDGKSSIEIYYDDQCNLCDRTIRVIKMLDWFSAIILKPMSMNQSLIQSRGLTSDQVNNDLYGYDVHTRRLYKGYDLYIEFTARLLPLVVLYPLFFAGKIFRVGSYIYSFIASRRRRLFGVCHIPTVKFDSISNGNHISQLVSQQNSFFSAFLLTYVIFLFTYLVNFPYFNSIPGWQSLRNQFSFVGTVPSSLNGQIPIKVFTPEVISMGSHYFTVSGVFDNGERKLLPYVGPHGERLRLVRLSDRLYFGHALGWRRSMYGKDGQSVCYESQRDDKYLLELFAVAEHIWRRKPSHYQIDYYSQGVPDPKAALNYEYKLPAGKHVCTISAQRELVDSNKYRLILV